MPIGGKSECTVTSQSIGAPGTVPAGGDRIRVISVCCRTHGIRVAIMTDEVTIVIDVP